MRSALFCVYTALIEVPATPLDRKRGQQSLRSDPEDIAAREFHIQLQNELRTELEKQRYRFPSDYLLSFV